MSTTNGDKYIGWGKFFWIIGGLCLILGGVLSFLYSDINEVSHDVTIIKGDVIEIKTHIKYIREKFDKKEIGALLPDDVVFAPKPTVYDPTITPVYMEPIAL